MKWTFHYKPETVSTNIDARAGAPGDVFLAGFQTAGRGRLDHVWTSPRGKDLLMSVVLPVAGLEPQAIATLPLVIGLAVCEAVDGYPAAALKWPNDVFLSGRKVAGILCERCDDNVIAGIGVNVGQTEYAAVGGTVEDVRDRVLSRLDFWHGTWVRGGFAAVHPHLVARDWLKGREISVWQTDDDAAPVRGVCGGIGVDGSLDVGGVKVYAGEAHVEWMDGGR